MTRGAPLVVLSTLLAGCSSFSGLSGTGTYRALPAMVDIDCVTSTIAATPGVDRVEYQLDDLSPQQTSDRSAPLILNHLWQYEFGPYQAKVYIGQRRGFATYHNNNIGTHAALGDAERAAFAPLAKLIDDRLVQACDVPAPQDS